MLIFMSVFSVINFKDFVYQMFLNTFRRTQSITIDAAVISPLEEGETMWNLRKSQYNRHVYVIILIIIPYNSSIVFQISPYSLNSILVILNV